MDGAHVTDIAYEPVSLGDTCAAKFQICRKLHAIMFPAKSELAFRLSLIPPEHGRRFFGKDLFDWQGTSIDNVSISLERDFEGMFEREDLEIKDDAVFHRVYGTNFIHYFDKALYKGAMPKAVLDAQYPSAAVLHRRMSEAFRARLSKPGPYLYIHRCNAFPTADQVERLIAALSGRSPKHRFHLLFVGLLEKDQDYSRFGDLVSKGYRTNEDHKPYGRDWEENDHEWDRALAPFRLTPNPEILAAMAAAAPKKAEAAPESAKPKGFFARLRGG